MQDCFFKRTWAQIDLGALNDNFLSLRKIVPQKAKIMSVVKADAYGHGVRMLAKWLAAAGTDWFAVSSFYEAEQLRRFNISLPILILGYTPQELAGRLKELNLTQTVYSYEYAEKLSAAAIKAGITVDIHIKLDIGMGRIGFNANNDSCADEVADICRLEGLNPTGIFAHFPSADYDGDSDGKITHKQFELFCRRVDEIENKGIHFDIKHCCNSAAAAEYPEMCLDMVREGISLYGLYPSSEVRHDIGLKPVMSLKSVITMVKTINKGRTVSYGSTFIAEHDMTVATVCIGYADGYPRAMSNKARILVNGQFAPVLGRVCMDQLMIDITGIENVTEGTGVTVFGTDKDKNIPVEEISALSGTINYETVCLVCKRVPRVYTENGEVISVLDQLTNGG